MVSSAAVCRPPRRVPQGPGSTRSPRGPARGLAVPHQGPGPGLPILESLSGHDPDAEPVMKSHKSNMANTLMLAHFSFWGPF